MPKLKYFTECDGATVELQSVWYATEKQLQLNWLPVPEKGVRMLVFCANGERRYEYAIGHCPRCPRVHAVARKIEYKSNPSKHKCDVRCLHATGKIMRCECSCGGKNHGKGN